ncbi:MAG TPA: proline--tRNA ligase [Polyangiaceae bacterium]|nr:proline--tRNA ligase [Polyangiaceae bacterium]
MRYRNSLLPTLKEAPADATSVSHVLLLRAGFIRRMGAGIYSFLPLGVRVLNKVATIIREEMNRAGSEEVLLPALLPAEYFQESGRWDVFGDTLFRLKDRKRGDYHLGPTHEEIITDVIRREVKSYRDLPKSLYQIQTKFRDEPRPRGGLLRCREFIMKDAYSFHVSEDDAKQGYEAMRLAYRRSFDRMGLDYRMVKADSGAMGGSGSAEFQVLVQSGEDLLVACKNCEYAANLEVAESAPLPPVGPEGEPPPALRVHTPKVGSIADVSRFLKLPPERFLKSLVYLAGDELVLAVVRGDHEVHEVKLARALGLGEVHLASAADVEKATGAAVGFAGPVGFKGRVVVDRDAASVRDAVTGANESDHHLVHVSKGRDFEAEVAQIRHVLAGDRCPSCNAELESYRGIEAGHIFLLGTRYTAAMGGKYLDETGKEQTIVMGCYGIGVSRLVATVIEQHNDQNGIRWPMSLAPFQVQIVALGDSAEVKAAVDQIEAGLEKAGIEVLVDDREERPGVKFKDADLVGVPLRVTVGEKGLKTGHVELKPRSEPDPKKAELVPLGAIVETLVARVRAELGSAR